MFCVTRASSSIDRLTISTASGVDVSFLPECMAVESRNEDVLQCLLCISNPKLFLVGIELMNEFISELAMKHAVPY
jgi:hypothetical protein